MSRKESQSSISAYYMQPLGEDFMITYSDCYVRERYEKIRINQCLVGLCRKGHAVYGMGGKHYNVECGCLVFLLPGYYLDYYEASDDCEIVFAVLSDKFMKEVSARFPNAMITYLIENPVYPLGEESMSYALLYYNLLEAKMNDKNNIFLKDIVYCIVYSVYLEIYDMIMHRVDDLPLGKTENERIFDKLELLVHNHIRENQPLSFYSDLLNVTTNHLNRIVKNYCGVSLKHYIDEVRIYELKHVLMNTMKSIQEISIDFGFSAPEAFNHYFRRYVGVSPSAFRSKKQ